VQHGQPATHEPANSPCGNLFGLPLPMKPDRHNASTSVQHTCACGVHRTRKNQKGGGRDYRYPPVSRSPHPPGTFSNKKNSIVCATSPLQHRSTCTTGRHVDALVLLDETCACLPQDNHKAQRGSLGCLWEFELASANRKGPVRCTIEEEALTCIGLINLQLIALAHMTLE
jgi:hypothetical protein